MSDADPGTPSWAFLEQFRCPAAPRWEPATSWARIAISRLPGLRRELEALAQTWRDRLDPLPEIADLDWRRFRPLRLSREEAWSDWLAHMLETSVSGTFALGLFGEAVAHPSGQPAKLVVEREVALPDRVRRADILIRVNAAAWVHVEVKVGDKSFEKTFETADLLRRQFGRGQPWADFVLLPPEDEGEWEAEAQKQATQGPTIQVLTWRNVAVALRAALWRRDESLPWRTWAHSYCGAIEQRLLGCVCLSDRRMGDHSFEQLLVTATQLRLLQESRA